MRLGIVMFGGVSLAIYICGVSGELFRSVRGRGLYKLIKTLTDSEIVVDVISGASAGGINGIMLAYALCNEFDFDSAADLWREHADIYKLLRSPDEIAKIDSLLNGDCYYRDQIENAFAMMKASKHEDEAPSPIEELDLFITGTDIGGAPFIEFDDAGSLIENNRHNAVFWLKHRQGRKEPFYAKEPTKKSEESPVLERCPAPEVDPKITHQALAKLARITSCFPGAFAPIYVKNAGKNDEVDSLLQVWSNLYKDTYFQDGGVLDNKPFSYTIEAIFSRTADRAVDRKLLYIEPNPEEFIKPDPEECNAQTPRKIYILQSVKATLLDIRGYESIAEDLQRIENHNLQLRQRAKLVSEINKSSPQTGNRDLYEHSKTIFFSQRVVEGLLSTNKKRDKFHSPLDQRAAKKILSSFEHPLTPTERKTLFDGFDIYFRQRQIFHTIYSIYDLLHKTSDDPKQQKVDLHRAEKYQQVWEAFNRLVMLCEIIQAEMESLIQTIPIEWTKHRLSIEILPEDKHEEQENQIGKEIWERVSYGLDRLLDGSNIGEGILPHQFSVGSEWLDSCQLTEFHQFLQGRRKTIVDAMRMRSMRLSSIDPVPNICARVDKYGHDIITTLLDNLGDNDEVTNAYMKYEHLDCQIYPIEMLAGLREKDIIKTIRISPLDAQKGFSKKDRREKVAGTKVDHFGAFFKRYWRSNDLLWGRLDGLCQLTECLLTKERIENLIKDEALRCRLRLALEQDPSIQPEKLFQNVDEKTRGTLKQWLHNLVCEDSNKRQSALASFEEHRDLLIEAAQFELLVEEFPKVIEDACSDGEEWNKFGFGAGDSRMSKGIRYLSDRLRPASGRTGSKNQLDNQDAEQEPLPEADQSRPPDTTKERAVHEERLDPKTWTFQTPGGQFDPFLALTSMSTSSFKEWIQSDRTAGRPTETSFGQFFRKCYKLDMDSPTRHVSPLVLLQVVAITLRVVTNAIWASLGNKVDRIRYKLPYLIFTHLPLRAFHALVSFACRQPTAVILIIAVLALLSALTLLIGVIWYGALVAGALGWVALVIVPILILVSVGMCVILYLQVSNWSKG